MSATELLLRERRDLCDTFAALGPDAPTLCEGWTCADLAAHLLVRETRLDALLGIAPIPRNPFASYTARLMEQAKATGYEPMLERLRSGPPLLFRAGPAAAPNLSENWIHHEDARRANGQGPRPADPAVERIQWRGLALTAFLAARRVPGARVRIVAEGYGERTLRSGDIEVVIAGPPGELALYFSGRKGAARVELSGSEHAVAMLEAARFGV